MWWNVGDERGGEERDLYIWINGVYACWVGSIYKGGLGYGLGLWDCAIFILIFF